MVDVVSRLGIGLVVLLCALLLFYHLLVEMFGVKVIDNGGSQLGTDTAAQVGQPVHIINQ